MSETSPLTEGEFATHDAYLRSLARRLLTGAHAGVAEDAVHDTWLRFLRRPPALDRPVRPWLARVLRNRSLELRRTAGRRGTPEPWSEPASRALPIDERVARREAAEDLRAAVRALREPYRGTIELLFQEGLTPAAAAARLGVPEATVRSRQHRALHLLREDLDRRGEGRGGDWLGGLVLLADARPRSTLRTLGLGLGAALVAVTAAGVWLRATATAPDLATPALARNGIVEAGEALAAAEAPTERVALGAPAQPVPLRIRLRRAFSGERVADVLAVASEPAGELTRGLSDADGTLELSLFPGRALVLDFGATASTDPLRVELDERWAERPLLEVELPAVCDVEGLVEWAPGMPASGIRVQAIRGPFPSFLDGDPPRVLATTRTRPDGTFRLERVPIEAGLLASDDEERRYGLYGPPRGRRAEQSPMWDEGMTRGPEDLLDAATRPAIRLAAAETLSVTVLGPDGAPVEGAELLLKGSAYTLRRGRSDVNGLACFHPLSDHGEQVLVVRAPGLGEWVHGPFLFLRERAEWVVRLEEPRTIEGGVLDRDGVGVGHARVLATLLESAPSPVGDDPLYPLPRGIATTDAAQADAAGRFTLEGLGGGTYLLEAFHGERLVGRGRFEAGERDVVLGGAPLGPLLRFRGTVRDALDGRPIPGALAVLEQSRGQRDERVSRRAARLDGADFAFEVDEPGRWVLHVAAEGYAPFSSTPTDFGPGSHVLEPLLHPGREVVLEVVDARGRPLREGWVQARAEAVAGERPFAGVTVALDEDGRARLRQVPCAGVEALVFAPYHMRPFVVTVPPDRPGAETVVRGVLEADCTTPRIAWPWVALDTRAHRALTQEELDPLELVVDDEDGTRVLNVLWIRPSPEQKPLESGRVRVPVAGPDGVTVVEDAPPSPWWWFGPGPLFSRDGEPCLPALHLAPGRYRLRLSAGGFRPLERWLEVGAVPTFADPLRLELVPTDD